MQQNKLKSIQAQLEQLISYEVENKSLPSISYVLVDRNAVLASNHFVRNDLTHQLSDKSVFRVGSISKMFATISLMQLVEKKLVDLDVDVSDYIPGFNPINPYAKNESGVLGTNISLRKLMSHTSGMVREPTVGHYLDDNLPTLTAVVDGLKTCTLKEDPSAGVFQYSNAGISIVGSIIESISGQSYNDYVQEHILTPVGMNQSSFEISSAVNEYLAPAFMWNMEGDFSAPVFDVPAPAGNLYSTGPDMARFLITLLRGGYTPNGVSIISPTTLQLMWTQVGMGYHKEQGYGFGFGLNTIEGWRSVGHGGAIYGYSTQMCFLPDAGFGIVLFSSLDATNSVISRIQSFVLQLMLASENMGKTPASPQRPLPLTGNQLTSIPGPYQNEILNETVEVKEKNGKLYLMGDGVPLQLQPNSENDFVIDGRCFGPGSEYPYLAVTFSKQHTTGGFPTTMGWKDREWTRMEAAVSNESVPENLESYIGEYGPDINITYLVYEGGGLKCLIEYFYAHSLEELTPTTFKMHGLLYEDEILELGAVNDAGESGIRVGPMFLARRI